MKKLGEGAFGVVYLKESNDKDSDSDEENENDEVIKMLKIDKLLPEGKNKENEKVKN